VLGETLLGETLLGERALGELTLFENIKCPCFMVIAPASGTEDPRSNLHREHSNAICVKVTCMIEI
jgi:hypothetical protein